MPPEIERFSGENRKSVAPIWSHRHQADTIREAAIRKGESDTRPPKPFAGFPLSARQNGQCWKNVKAPDGCKPRYFGPWADDPKGTRALAEFNRSLPLLTPNCCPPQLSA